MSLSPRAIALQGIGLTPLDAALQGLVLVATPPPPPPAESEDATPGHGRIRRARHAADFQPAWLLEALQPAQTPRRAKRARKRRERELLILS